MAAPFDKSGIIEFFLIEAGEHIQNLNKGLLSLEKNPADSSIIDELFRAAHTLKGSAAMMGFQGISDVAHKAEDMLGQFRSGTIPIRKETLNFLFDSVDAAKLMVDGVAGNKAEDPLVVSSIATSYKEVIEKVRSGSSSPAAQPPKEKQAAPVPVKPAAAKPAAPPAPEPAKAKTQQPAAAKPPVEKKSALPAAPAALPAGKVKDDLDLAWEKTFDNRGADSRRADGRRDSPGQSSTAAALQRNRHPPSLRRPRPLPLPKLPEAKPTPPSATVARAVRIPEDGLHHSSRRSRMRKRPGSRKRGAWAGAQRTPPISKSSLSGSISNGSTI